MPSSPLFQALFFAAGAALGATAVSLSNNRRERVKPVHSSPTAIVDVSPSGKPALSQRELVAGDVLKYGNPGPISDLICRKAYTLGYDRKLRHPAWTVEHLTLASVSPPPDDPNGGDRSKSVFKEDESIPRQFRAFLKDYFRSGYDRGHLAPAADAKSSQEAMDETFYLTNIAPQVGDGFNRHYWAYLENWCRKLTGSFSDVFVFTVPLYLPKQDADGKWRVTYEMIGTPANVAVPTHFAKVVLASRPGSAYNPRESELSLGAFVLPNASIPDETPMEKFLVDVDTVERAAGLTLFSDEVKGKAINICRTTKCELVIRRFDDARKNATKAIGAPRR
ncbi:Mitochondrial nuclease [Serendipita indica DSM 11827]|uniref:Endonuclease n=1 Tax=Serendipita indica (strain DSM 11827) TaxID=1109443 RepID=G4T775_SERID|nr:Mitochondrial nuclease [Serendipita indica DSM 11827]CCA67176.1 probable NUC1-dna/rna non-specific nuclease, mitochondrial [Serendipita indica DSM 11827]